MVGGNDDNTENHDLGFDSRGLLILRFDKVITTTTTTYPIIT